MLMTQVTVVLALVSFTAAAAAPTASNALELRRVILSTGGIGYFEYEGVVEGNVQMPITVRLDQVDDVLKSLVIYDSRGTAGIVSLPGQEPLKDAARELPFKLEALESSAALLRALQGADIRVSGP